ncbi:MAG: peptidoglycan-binding protein LysM [Flavobacteriaceae bacterium]|nr:peptidoglycan-binding protein LysM [Flavobacteriaceae bacterium]
MIKNTINYFAIPLAIATFISIALNTNQAVKYKADPADYSTEGLELHYTVGEPIAYADSYFYDYNPASQTYMPYLGKTYHGFKEALGFKESGGNYFSVNTLGYLGKYQFGEETLKMIGIYNTDNFLRSPRLQEKAFIANISRNKWILRKDIQKYAGTKIGNVLVTESGILAAAHLAGPGSVKKFLKTSGKKDFSDAYGSTVAHYMKKFSGYDTTSIEADRRAKAVL